MYINFRIFAPQVLIFVFSVFGGLFLVFLDWLALFLCGCLAGYFIMNPAITGVKILLASFGNGALLLPEWLGNQATPADVDVHDWRSLVNLGVLVAFSLSLGVLFWCLRKVWANSVVALVSGAVVASSLGELCILLSFFIVNRGFDLDNLDANFATENSIYFEGDVSRENWWWWSSIFNFRVPLPFQPLRKMIFERPANWRPALAGEPHGPPSPMVGGIAGIAVDRASAFVWKVKTALAEVVNAENMRNSALAWLFLSLVLGFCAGLSLSRMRETRRQPETDSEEEELLYKQHQEFYAAPVYEQRGAQFSV